MIILSYSFWQRRFAGNPAAIVRSIAFEGKRYTVERATPRVAQRPTLPVSPRSRKTIPTPCGPSPKAAVIWPHCPFLGLVLLHAKSGVYPHSCSHVHANVMISDSLEPHAARLTFAILQPRLDPPPILKCCCKPSTGEPFMGSTITSSPPLWSRIGTKPACRLQFGTPFCLLFYKCFTVPFPHPFLFQYFRTTIFWERHTSSRYVSTMV